MALTAAIRRATTSLMKKMTLTQSMWGSMSSQERIPKSKRKRTKKKRMKKPTTQIAAMPVRKAAKTSTN